MATVHVIPLDDAIDHDQSDDCVCGPVPEFVEGNEGSGWLYTHASLDGREVNGGDHDWVCVREAV